MALWDVGKCAMLSLGSQTSRGGVILVFVLRSERFSPCSRLLTLVQSA
jgi:hypothetical protein